MTGRSFRWFLGSAGFSLLLLIVGYFVQARYLGGEVSILVVLLIAMRMVPEMLWLPMCLRNSFQLSPKEVLRWSRLTFIIIHGVFMTSFLLVNVVLFRTPSIREKWQLELGSHYSLVPYAITAVWFVGAFVAFNILSFLWERRARKLVEYDLDEFKPKSSDD